ncbi:hypothetical protein GGI12_005183, partial [Dipsacomyces acuminosporus]
GARLPDMSSLITPLFSCLQDRNSDVRKQAHRVLELTVASCGFEAVYDACNSQLRGASKTTVAPMIEELRHTITTAGVQPKAGAAGGTGGVRGGARLGAGIGASDRAPSPAVEPVMTASELIGRSTNRAAGTPPQPQLAAPASSAVGAQGGAGQGMLRRPMAVRRPAGATSTIAAMRQARPARAPPASAESSRPGSSLRSATPTQASAASQLARLSNEELEAIPPILDSDVRAKEQRARRDMAANPHGMPRWMQLGDARVRADLESQLSEQMAAHVNPLFHRQLFSTGHYKDRDYLSGLSSIEEVISINGLSQQRFRIPLYADSSMPDEDSLASRYLANIDLLLKYISIRMFDGSTHTLLKSFDLLERLIQITEQSQQQSQQTASWSDYDVQAVLPALISRLGDAKEVVRARSRRVLTQSVTHLYPATKIFTMLLEHGVTNKSNARIRQESLDCICFLIRERTAGLGLGAVCAQPARAVPIIAQGVADRDSNVRTATLNVLVAVGEQLQGGADELWRLCGRMAEKERTMLEEKLKRSTIGAGSAASSSGTLQGNGDAFAQRPGSRAGLAGQLGGAGAAASARSRLSQYGAPAGPGIGAGLRSAGPGIGRPGFGAGAGAAAAAAGAVAGSGMNIGNIISAISMQLRWAYTTTSTDPSMQSPIQVTLGRIRKTTLGLLIDIFSDPRLALWVSQDAMQTLLEELIRRLVDPMLKQSSRLRGSAPGAGAGRGMIANAEQLSKAINTIVIKILDKADRTTVYVSLIQMLESSLAEPAPNPPQSDADVVRMDFGDMVMRCLWRLTKPLPMELQAQFARVVESGAASVPADIANPRFGDPRYHQQIRIDPVLRMAHRFFVHVPDREWRKREDRDKWMYGDLPKRTVKTITHSFITVLRGLIWQFTGLIIRDVMEEHPGLLSAPPPAASSSSAQQLESDPALTSWVDDSHAKLVRASETWSYLHTTLEMADPRISKPTASQFMAAMHIAQTAREDDASDDEQDAVMAS